MLIFESAELAENLTLSAVTGNFSLGIFLIKSESYDEIKESLAEILDILSELKKINIDANEYDIEFWLGGDLKFLALVLGLYEIHIMLILRLYLLNLNFLYLRHKCSKQSSPLHLLSMQQGRIRPA